MRIGTSRLLMDDYRKMQLRFFIVETLLTNAFNLLIFFFLLSAGVGVLVRTR